MNENCVTGNFHTKKLNLWQKKNCHSAKKRNKFYSIFLKTICMNSQFFIAKHVFFINSINGMGYWQFFLDVNLCKILAGYSIFLAPLFRRIIDIDAKKSGHFCCCKLVARKTVLAYTLIKLRTKCRKKVQKVQR